MRKKLKMAREMSRGRRALQSSVGQLLSLLLARHVVYSIFSGPKPSASHALVDFGDEGTAISDIDFIVLKSYTIVRTYIVTAVQELA